MVNPAGAPDPDARVLRIVINGANLSAVVTIGAPALRSVAACGGGGSTAHPERTERRFDLINDAFALAARN